MSEIPRNPEHYTLTLHAKQQRRHRDIHLQYIEETIKDGEIKNSHKKNCVLFVRDFISKDDPVGVVVDYTTGDILTVEYRE